MTATSVDIVSDLSFEFAPPCEAICHADTAMLGLSAEFIVDVTCACGVKVRYIICIECLNIMLSSVLGCGECGMVDPGNECVRVVGKV